ncbi:MAG: hypothetical protein ACXVJT_17365, partial [Thermoanaerobaculia bacterium]
LLRSELDLGDLNGRFAKLGVRRQRRLLLALENDAPIGFALAEVSSPGLNLYEALSSFRIFVLAAGAHVGDEVRASLLSALLPIYRQSGRRLARGIIDPRDADSFRRLGIVLDDKQSMCWTAHRSIHQRFAEHVNRFFERLEARRHRHVKETHLG